MGRDMRRNIKVEYINGPLFELEDDTIYVNLKKKELLLNCMNPECRRRVRLTLGHKGKWNIKTKGFFRKRVVEPVTITPSIWSKHHKDECHYTIINGVLTWYPNEK